MATAGSDDQPVNLEEYEALARRLLPPAVFDFIAGGSEDGVTLRGNRLAFDRWCLLPRALTGVAAPSLATTVLGQPVSLPVVMAPMGLHRLAHPDGERASASAAHRAGTVFSLGIAASMAMEEVSAATGGWWFQLYLLRDRGITLELVRRAEQAGADALYLTVDVAVRGRREADERNRFEMPPGITMPNLLPRDFAGDSPSYFVLTAWETAITWRDLEWLVASTRLPVVVKGLLHPADAALAVDHGARGVVVSNHGGRQLDGAVATLDALPAVVAAVDGRAEVLFDGGIRRGTDVLKALALGARAVLLGRPVLYGLAAGGEEGVARVLELLRAELITDCILAGVADIACLPPDLAVPAGPLPIP